MLLIITVLSVANISCRTNTVKAEDSKPKCEIATWKNFAKGCVTYTFDDGYDIHFTSVRNMLNQYGYKGTFYIITSLMNDYKWELAKEMAEEGHEIGSHTVSHDYLTDENSDNELGTSKEIIENKIGKPCLTVAYPYCAMPTQSYVEKYYISARGCSGDIERSNPYNYMYLGSIICGDQGTAVDGTAMCNMIKKAADNSGWAVFLIHDLAGSGYSPIVLDDLKMTLDFIKSNENDYYVATFADATKYSKERVNSNLNVEESNGIFYIELKDTLDNAVYDEKLSIRIENKYDWENVEAVQNGQEIETEVTDEYIYFDSVPDAGEIIIKEKKIETDARIDIYGYQISSTYEGMRTIYNIYDPYDEIEGLGIVYGIESTCTESEMTVGGNGTFSYPATENGKINSDVYMDDGCTATYSMTMKFASKTAQYFTEKHYIRAYAILDTGDYIYSDIYEMSIFNLADILYRNSNISNYSTYQYLYDNILSVTDINYEKMEYNWGNTLLKR